jgi:hypothetical protein
MAAIAFLGLSTHASANPTGVATITNCTPNGGVKISVTSITWLPVAGANEGCIATSIPTSISYSGGTLTAAGTGTIENLTTGSIDPFLVLAGGVLDFSLASFEPPTPTDGVCSNSVALASAHSCVAVVGSPFLLISQGASTELSATTDGVVTDTGNSSTTPYTGLFSSTLGFTTADIAAVIDTGGSILTTYTATLTLGPGTGATVPEPSTLAILSIGSVLIGITRRCFGKR